MGKHAIAKLFHYYVTLYLTFALILAFWTACNWAWKSGTFQSYKIIAKLERRITKLALLIILCIPCRYILRLMAIPPQHAPTSTSTTPASSTIPTPKSLHKRHKSVPNIATTLSRGQHKVRDSIDMKDIKELLFGSFRRKSKTSASERVKRVDQSTPFQDLDLASTLHTASTWTPLLSELLEMARVFSLFAKIRVHGQRNLPKDTPSLIIVNHALGHGFDVPMMVYVLRRFCGLSRVRVLVSPAHLNWPIWCDLVYYLGGVPRTHAVAERLMRSGENLLMFAAKKHKSAMVWDAKKQLFLDLVHKYDYALVPAVCVSDADVIDMVYNIRTPRVGGGRVSGKQSAAEMLVDTDGDTDNATDEDDEASGVVTLKTIRGRLRSGYRTQFHLRFSPAISVPKSKSKRLRKSSSSRRSAEFKVDDDWADNESLATPRSTGHEVRFSGLNFEYKGLNESDDEKREDERERGGFRKRRWSRELEVGLKTAVEDAMTDGISEMFSKLKSDPNSSMIKTMQKKMSSQNEYAAALQSDIQSPTPSNDVPRRWLE